MSSEFYCKFCAITCSGKAPFEQHLQSAKHIKKAQENPSSLSSQQPVSPTLNASSSPVIQRPTSSTTNFQIPEDTSAALPSLSMSAETMRILLEWNHPDGHPPFCDICQLPLHGGNNVDLHFHQDNRIHHQKLAVWKTIQEGDARYSCKVCSEIFNSEKIMRDHFTSEPHGSMVQQKSNLKKFIQIYETYDKLKQARKQSNESKSALEDDLPNEFTKLKVIDVTGQSTKPKQFGLFSADKLSEIMRMKVAKDDDD